MDEEGEAGCGWVGLKDKSLGKIVMKWLATRLKESVRHTLKPNGLTSHGKMHQCSAENQMEKTSTGSSCG